MNAALQTQLAIGSFVCSTLALFFSLVAAFPGMKPVLAAIRDGVLWFCLFIVVGGVAFVVWQQVQLKPAPPASLARVSNGQAAMTATPP
jgi:hypothetical protein